MCVLFIVGGAIIVDAALHSHAASQLITLPSYACGCCCFCEQQSTDEGNKVKAVHRGVMETVKTVR